MLHKVSTSAKGVAYLRHLELNVSRDTLAKYFFDSEGEKIGEKWLKLYPYLARKIAIRGRYIEDTIIHYSKKKNIKQIINIASGLNTFPYRHPDVQNIKSYLEIDLPDMMEFKKFHIREIIKQGERLNKEPKVEYFSLDLSSSSAAGEFYKINWKWDLPSIYVFEGISYYLRYEKLKELIKIFAKSMVKGSLFIMDYFPEIAKKNNNLQRILNDLPKDGAETCLTYFNKNKLIDLFHPSFAIISDRLERDLEPRYYSSLYSTSVEPSERGAIVTLEKI